MVFYFCVEIMFFFFLVQISTIVTSVLTEKISGTFFDILNQSSRRVKGSFRFLVLDLILVESFRGFNPGYWLWFRTPLFVFFSFGL